MKKITKYKNLLKGIILMTMIRYFIVNYKRISIYYAKKIFYYFFESEEEFYMHAPYIVILSIGILLNVVAQIIL